MVNATIVFPVDSAPILSGVHLDSKSSIVDSILDLLALNGYQFMAFVRPIPELLLNLETDPNSVSFDSLKFLLERLYNYCSHFPFKCLTEFCGVVVKNDGVHSIEGNQPLLLNVDFSFDGSDLLPFAERTKVCTISELSYVVKHFFDNYNLSNKKVVIS